MKKILVIEDNAEIRENVAELLSLEGYSVSAAGNGKQGIEAALRELPDLVLCDVSMPEMDGYGVLARLRANSVVGFVPFIFLTARAEKLDVQHGLRQGAQEYIVKPFTAEQLMKAVLAALTKKAG